MKTALVLFVLCLISGCAATPQSLRPRTAPPDSQKATLYLIFEMNDPRVYYAADVWVDGHRMCHMRRQQYTWMYVEPGEHSIEVKAARSGRLLAERTMALDAGGRQYLSVSWFDDDRPEGLVLVQALVGKSERPEFKKPMRMNIIAPDMAASYIENFTLLDPESPRTGQDPRG